MPLMNILKKVNPNYIEAAAKTIFKSNVITVAIVTIGICYCVTVITENADIKVNL